MRKKNDDLTDSMREALIDVGFGVQKYNAGISGPGYYSIEDASKKIDGRSIQALFRRDLVGWLTTGAAPMRTMLALTDEGWAIFQEVERGGAF